MTVGLDRPLWRCPDPVCAHDENERVRVPVPGEAYDIFKPRCLGCGQVWEPGQSRPYAAVPRMTTESHGRAVAGGRT